MEATFTSTLRRIFFFLGAILFGSFATAQDYNTSLPQQCNTVTGGTEIITFPMTPASANSDGTLTILYQGDLDLSTEILTFLGEGGNILGTSTNVAQCSGIGTFTATIPMIDIISWASDGQIVITVQAASSVNALSNCVNGQQVSFCVTPTLQYGVTTAPNDIGVASLDSPSVFCAGSQDLYATIRNYGTTPVDSFTVNWAWNGVLETPFQVVAAMDTVNGAGPAFAQVFLGTKTITDKDTIEIWTTNPNGMADTITVNDSLFKVVTPSLNGTFSVGGLGANYPDLSSALVDINEVGICGPVVFNLTPGMNFTEQLIFNDYIGASASQFITINGNNDTIEFVSTNASQRATLIINGGDYISFNNIHFRANAIGTPGEYGWATWLTNGADYITFNGCSFIARNDWNSTFSQAFVASQSATSATTVGVACNNLTVDNCNVYGGYYGLAIGGATTPPFAQNNTVTNTNIQDYYLYGTYIRGQENLVFDNNESHRPGRGSTITTWYGLFFTGPMPNGRITRNNVHNPIGPLNSPTTSLSRAMFLSGVSGGGIGDVVVANNIIHTINNNGTNTGMYFTTCSDIKALHNSISMDNTLHTGTQICYGIYNTGSSSGLEIQNNIVYDNQSSFGNHYGYYFNTIPAVCDYNDVYFASTSGTNYFGYNGSPHLTLADWQVANPGLDANSLNVDPQFSGLSVPGNTDLYNAGTNVLAYVAQDYLGNARPAAPDMGSYQTPPVVNNIGVVSLDSPYAFCPGTENVIVTIGNYGGNQITSFTVNWSIDGIAQTPVNSTTLLDTLGGAGSTETQVTLGTHSFSAGVPYDFKIWTSGPNGQTDPRPNSDTISATLLAAINGTFLIGPSPTADFDSINGLIQALQLGGLCGPIVANLEAGATFNEQVLIGDFTGMDSINTLTINGNGDTLTYLSNNSVQRYTLGLNGAKWVTINDLNVVAEANGTVSGTYGWAGLVTGLSEHINFHRCSFLASTTWNSTFSQSFAATSSPTSATTQGTACNYLTLDSCYFKGGYYGLVIQGPNTAGTYSKGNIVTNNRIEDSYFYQMYFRGQEDGLFENNNASRQNRPTLTTFYGMYLNGPMPGSRFLRNNMHHPRGSSQGATTSTTYGMFITGVNNGGGVDPLIANNIVHSLNQNGTTYGAYFSTVSDVKFYHNAIGVDNEQHTGTGAGYGVFLTGTTANVRIVNNIIKNSQSGSGFHYSVRYNTAPALSDHNDLFISNNSSANVGVGYLSSTGYTTLAAWQANGLDSNSVDLDPITAANMLPINPALKGLGANLNADVPTDINGVVRPSSPDMGAYEFTPSTCIFPTQLSTANVLPNSADLNWVENGTSTTWEIQYGAPGFIPGTGTQAVTSSKPYTLSGLNSNTSYEFYVRSYCGPTDTSAWGGPLSFTTACNLFGSPLFEDFDGPSWTSGTVFSNTNDGVDPCWNRSSGSYSWRVSSTGNLGNHSSSTAPAADFSGSGNFLYTEASGSSNGDSTFFESPWVNLDSVTAPLLSFATHVYGTTSGTLLAQVSSDGANWTTIWSQTGQVQTSSSDPWIEHSVSVPSIAQDTAKFRFVGVSQGCCAGDMAIDAIRFRQAPTNDLGTISVAGIPAQACGLGTNETIDVTVANQGASQQDTFDIEYNTGSGWIFGTTITTPLAAGMTQTYQVAGVDLSATGAFCLEARAVLLNDEDSTNDVSTPLCYVNLVQPTITAVQGAEICEAGPISVSVTTNADTVAWYDDPALTNQVGSGTTLNIANLTTTTTYYVQGTNSNGCQTAPSQALATVNTTPQVDFTFIPNGSTVDFTSSITGSVDSILWDFGDGNTSTAQSPSHTYTQTQTYLVTHSGFKGSCIGDTIKAIFVQVIGLENNPWSSSISVYPNPSDGGFEIEIPEVEGDVIIEILDMKGTSVYRNSFEANGSLTSGIELPEASAGNHLIKIINGEKTSLKRISIK